MHRLTFFSQKISPLFRPLSYLTNANIICFGGNLRNSLSLIRESTLQHIFYRQISSKNTEASKSVGDNNDDFLINSCSGGQDPHSKIMEILRESTAMSNQTHAIESQVKYGKIFRYGELYAPYELNEDKYKGKRNTGRSTRKPPSVDIFNALKLNPLNYKLLSNFVSDMGRILPRSITGLTAKNQRKLAKAIKRARSFGLIPSTHRRKADFYDVELMMSQMKNKKASDFMDFE
ncbi:2755_t:CDS:2 [Funneliformis geosporum]|uniref:Small ribosomal subunit protein bS18m n=1 Tax=Funneliformis geosporum TaxID=1117311 RepID=A0A9W4X577_9GLOM|nr:2755_t:CDS:2 [Funneliformis geosporum]CAI2187419.1 6655_t:CDS:2 [Funneliformis geosporum]